MSHGRVIQDSDDEDDPLSEMPPPTKRLAGELIDTTDAINEHSKTVETGGENQAVGHGNHITVDFDAFLQSQEAAQTGLSASQQRREERWIPSDAGAGSIGAVMTEIGLAQRRLFDDDDAQHGDVHVPQVTVCEALEDGPVAGVPKMSLNTAVSNYDAYNHQEESAFMHAFASPTSQDMAVLNAKNHGRGYSNNDITGFYGDHVMHVGPSNSLSSHDFAQSSTSYNFFDSSLDPRTHSNGDIQSLVESGDAQTGALHRTPGRSHSMEATPYSPHDTELISSLVSPNIHRSKSDTTCQISLPQSSTRASDELSAPVAVDLPALQKKRGRKRKQDLPEDDEDDELAISNDQNPPPNGIAEKRKPGRPPKSARIMDQEFNGVELSSDRPQDHSVAISGHAQEPQEDPLLNPSVSNETVNYAPHDTTEHEGLQVIVKDTPNDKQTRVSIEPPADIDLPTAKPSKKPKEPKKKKLKRGKTTSVTLKKTYESDVEDDVIWIDERPSNPAQDPQTCQTESPSTGTNHKGMINIEIPKPLPPLIEVNENEILPNTLEEEPKPAPPTPKKRGRKRKKTSELMISEEISAQVSEVPVNGQEQQFDKVTVVLEHPSNEATNTIPRKETTPSPTKPSTTKTNTPETPKKPDPQPTNPRALEPDTYPGPRAKGPDKHSPISGTSKVPYRVGLSRKARIAPLLKIVRR